MKMRGKVLTREEKQTQWDWLLGLVRSIRKRLEGVIIVSPATPY